MTNTNERRDRMIQQDHEGLDHEGLVQTICAERAPEWAREDAQQEARIAVWLLLGRNPDATSGEVAAAIRRQVGNLQTGQRGYTGQPQRQWGGRAHEDQHLSLDADDGLEFYSDDHAPAVVRRVWAEQALARLPHHQAEAVRLRTIEGLPWAEVAEIMNLSRQNVAKHHRNGLEQIAAWEREAADD